MVTAHRCAVTLNTGDLAGSLIGDSMNLQQAQQNNDDLCPVSVVEGQHGQALVGRRGPSGKLHQGLLGPVEQLPAGGWRGILTGDTRR